MFRHGLKGVYPESQLLQAHFEEMFIEPQSASFPHVNSSTPFADAITNLFSE